MLWTENSGQSEAFYIKTLYFLFIFSCQYNTTHSSRNRSIICFRIEHVEIHIQSWSISWLISHVLSYFVVSLRSLYLLSIKNMKVYVRSCNAIYFTWPCVYDMIGICEQVWNWKNVPSDSEHGIGWLQHRLWDRYLCSVPRNILLLCTDTRDSSVFLTFSKDQIIPGSGPWQ